MLKAKVITTFSKETIAADPAAAGNPVAAAIPVKAAIIVLQGPIGCTIIVLQ